MDFTCVTAAHRPLDNAMGPFPILPYQSLVLNQGFTFFRSAKQPPLNGPQRVVALPQTDSATDLSPTDLRVYRRDPGADVAVAPATIEEGATCRIALATLSSTHARKFS